MVATGRRASVVGWALGSTTHGEGSAGGVTSGPNNLNSGSSGDEGERTMQLQVLVSVALGPPASQNSRNKGADAGGSGLGDGKRTFGPGQEPSGITVVR